VALFVNLILHISCESAGWSIVVIKHEIARVQKNSIAAQLDIKSGDFLLAIDGKEVRDVLDYRFRIQEAKLLVEIEKACNEIWELDIEKDPDQDLGIEFKQSLMSHAKRCANRCIFCFVDQQPKGLRNSLYVKDDDPRMSFLLGNYVTLTNLSVEEINRLAGYRVSPLRISIHAADLDLRAKMMGTDAARNLFNALDVFKAQGIEMHFQIVLCKGLNDGTQLDYTIGRLAEYRPLAKSLAIVPAGLTKHRDGLYPLEVFGREDARAVINQLVANNNQLKNSSGFVHLSDEWYILAGLPLPSYEEYGSFPQLDNGVGILRLFQREFSGAMTTKVPSRASAVQGGVIPTIGIITGTAAAGFMRNIVKNFTKKHPQSHITVHPICNKFFGETVTVSGLLTGGDIIAQLKDMYIPGVIFIPENAFRAGVKEKVMLDGTTLQDLERELRARVVVGSADGGEFYRQLMAVL